MATEQNSPVEWNLRALMADAGMFQTTDLIQPLRDHGVQLSREQVFRLVTRTPERLNIEVLAALCKIFDCGPSELITVKPQRITPEADAAGQGRRDISIGDLRPVRARLTVDVHVISRETHGGLGKFHGRRSESDREADLAAPARRGFATGTSRWLFEGIMPGEHLSPAYARLRLSENGTRIRHARTTRLDLLAAQLPASIVADTLGVTLHTAEQRRGRSGGIWSSYPALRD